MVRVPPRSMASREFTARFGALTEEAKRFAGGHLVYTNLDPDTMRRLREALDDTGPMDNNRVSGDATTQARTGDAADATFAPPTPHTPHID